MFPFFFSVLNAWLKSRSPREVTVFQDLFEQSFPVIYAWETQNLQMKMDVLQCNIIQQILFILEGLVPQAKDEEQEAAVSVHESVDGKFLIISDSVPLFFINFNNFLLLFSKR